MTLLCLLYLGPLYEELIVDGAWRAISISTTKARLYDDWTGWRNYIVGPASEELIFRSLNVSLLLRAGVSRPTPSLSTSNIPFSKADHLSAPSLRSDALPRRHD